MPTYIYTCEVCGKSHERVMPVVRMQKSARCGCGKRALRDMLAEQTQTVHRPGNWPRLSDALGVGSTQIKEAVEHSIKNGCPTEFKPDGRAVITSARHQNALTVACGLFNRNGGYGDAAPKHYKGAKNPRRA